MAVPVIMPKQGQTVESCILNKWYKKKGDSVNAGDLLFNYETDKASFDVEAEVSGTLLDVFFDEGDDVPVFANVCVIGIPGENTEKYFPERTVIQKREILQGTESGDEKEDSASMSEETIDVGERAIRISPRARKLADKLGIDVSTVSGSGPDGRIIEKDIITAGESARGGTFSSKDKLSGKNVEGKGIGGRITLGDLENASSAAYREVKLGNVRKIIARAMHDSLSNAAQLTLHASFDATVIIGLRNRVKNGSVPGLGNVTFNDMILHSVSRTILNHGYINSHFLDDRMLVYSDCHLGFAVDTERGLMVPVIRNANAKTLAEISIESKELIESCRTGAVNPDLLRGGTFTVTNLGSLGVEMFTPIINAPQAGILGVNAIVPRPRETVGGRTTYPSMGLSLTFDHRAVDGAYAARFLRDLKNRLESFTDGIRAEEKNSDI